MYKKMLPIVVAALMLLVLFFPAQHTEAATTETNLQPVDNGEEIRAMHPSDDNLDTSGITDGGDSSAIAQQYSVGAQKYWLVLDSYHGQYLVKKYTLKAQGNLAEIWVQNDLSFPASNPRPTPVITQQQIDYLLGQFENNIYPTEKDFFRAPDYHDGSSAVLDDMLGFSSDYWAGDKFVILVSNVEDDNYWVPGYPIYTAGFYSGSYEYYFDRNIITIDSHDWANRMGPNVARPYLYEGIIAHEMQHLLHADADPAEETFVNEGIADFAMVLCGYGGFDSHLGDLVKYPENSLVGWKDQGDLELLADYGLAFMWTWFLYEKYGNTFVKMLFNDQKHGISGINSALSSLGTPNRFAGLFRDFSVALLIDWSMNNYQYGFKSVDYKVDIGTPMSPNPQAFNSPGAPAWGTDYIWLNKMAKQYVFDGADYMMYDCPWTVDMGWLWSGTGDNLDNWAIFKATGGGTLKFDTVWDLEDFYDFGFVQVSTDGGHTWSSLANGYTTSDVASDAISKVVENLPGLNGLVTSPVTMSFDLSAYAGKDIMIGFRLVTDSGLHYGGWWIDNVYVDGKLISDGTDASVFKDITGFLPIENDFMLTAVGFRTTMFGTTYTIFKFVVNDQNEMAGLVMSTFASYSKVALLITSCAPEGVLNYGQYTLKATY
jgi:immune inhibitor A